MILIKITEKCYILVAHPNDIAINLILDRYSYSSQVTVPLSYVTTYTLYTIHGYNKVNKDIIVVG